MNIRMKSNDSNAGWTLKLFKEGYKATYNLGPFGRTNWLIKKDGEAILVVQGENTGLTTKIKNPTEKQQEIAAALVKAGIAAIS